MTGWSRPALVVTFAAAAMLMVTVATRNTLGLFVARINSSTGLGVVTISFALAIAQFVWGAVQPLAGAVADRHGPRPGLAAGVRLVAPRGRRGPLAIARFVWGAVQPLAGAVADRHGPRPVLAAGLVLLALGTALTPLMSSGMGLVLVLGLLTAVGSGSASFSVLLGAAAQRLPPQARTDGGQ